MGLSDEPIADAATVADARAGRLLLDVPPQADDEVVDRAGVGVLFTPHTSSSIALRETALSFVLIR